MPKKYNRIKIVLAEKDRSSSWLAQQVGRDKSTVSRPARGARMLAPNLERHWCSNQMQPNVETLFRIAEVLGVDVRELLVSTK